MRIFLPAALLFTVELTTVTFFRTAPSSISPDSADAFASPPLVFRLRDRFRDVQNVLFAPSCCSPPTRASRQLARAVPAHAHPHGSSLRPPGTPSAAPRRPLVTSALSRALRSSLIRKCSTSPLSFACCSGTWSVRARLPSLDLFTQCSSVMNDGSGAPPLGNGSHPRPGGGFFYAGQAGTPSLRPVFGQAAGQSARASAGGAEAQTTMSPSP